MIVGFSEEIHPPLDIRWVSKYIYLDPSTMTRPQTQISERFWARQWCYNGDQVANTCIANVMGNGLKLV